MLELHISLYFVFLGIKIIYHFQIYISLFATSAESKKVKRKE